MNYRFFLLYCLIASLNLDSKEQSTLPSHQVVISPLWQYLDAGKICLRPGAMVITNNGSYRQADEFLYYPAGYYFGGKACSEMMSNWLPIDFEHVYIKNMHNTYRILTMLKADVVKSYDALIQWAIGAGAFGIASLAYYLNNFKNRRTAFSIGFNLDRTSPLNVNVQEQFFASDAKQFLTACFVISGLVSLGFSIAWAIKYYLWRQRDFLSEEYRIKLLASIKNWPDNLSAADYPLIALEKILTPGSTEGFMSKNIVTNTLCNKNRHITIYELDATFTKR